MGTVTLSLDIRNTFTTIFEWGCMLFTFGSRERRAPPGRIGRSNSTVVQKHLTRKRLVKSGQRLSVVGVNEGIIFGKRIALKASSGGEGLPTKVRVVSCTYVKAVDIRCVN